ncbi:alpha/beta hydrolase [Pseudoalteromonas sp. SG45-5]|uniref:alpha/beta hydrolase n=1 Tax=unclassified Pseudoalteromonas TaxID=194690 RepID=UPI0015FC385D|nr:MULTISPECIES: alpha/beta hydrolase [unclassified Pseudoalteromonas]MBB1386528.1 alpha/beta hydrolase [Pseudoalteromonas sp. SG45-5]MBB1394524.1 alpha/beta hydrolase [Pseudoalteromonas sp. SG44-4]MBB1447105.1 alpha/beta hydrolase [Pseudoalteromonas sp. SG41-6]
MRVYLYLLLKIMAVTLLLMGCNGTNKDSKLTGTEPSNLTKINLNNRSYYIAMPSNNFDAKKSYKLLLAFHGSGQGAKNMQSMAAFESASENYIVVYPQSKVEEWNEGCDCNKPHRLGINDLAFVENVVTDVKAKHNIIDEELFAVGFSQGGLFAQNLMCNSELKFTAIASVAAPMSEQLSQRCEIKNDTNYMMVHGTNDQPLPFEGRAHSNFGLIPSTLAIELIAKANGIDADVQLQKNQTVAKYLFKNETYINQLVAIEGGGHSWVFNDFSTTNEVVSFFDTVSRTKLDTYSKLYRIDQQQKKDVHVRSMGLEHSGPAIILLSGFNKNFHSDSAWFSLLQPLIAKTHRVHVIERFGNGFSSSAEQPSYASFVPALDKTLGLLNEKELIIVSFASANILAHLWQNSPDSQFVTGLNGMVWIDPDILLPHSISLYQDWPVYWFRDTGDALITHIEEGNWTQRTRDKLTDERTTVETLIASQYKAEMDWLYFDLISQSRTQIDKQVTRAREIMNYHDDLNRVISADIAKSIPISVIDTDFESYDIKNAEPEYVDGLVLWQQEGSLWSQQVSEQSGGQYIPLSNSDHMAVFQHPDDILKAIANIKSK